MFKKYFLGNNKGKLLIGLAGGIHVKRTYDSWREEEMHLCFNIPFSVFLFKLFPLKCSSALWGVLNDLELPTWIRVPYFRAYSWLTGVILDEMKEKNLENYKTMNDFFTRELIEGIRPICKDVDLVAPSDGLVLGYGKVLIPRTSISNKDWTTESLVSFLDLPNVMIEHVKGFRFPLWQFLGELVPWKGRSTMNGSLFPPSISFQDATPILASTSAPLETSVDVLSNQGGFFSFFKSSTNAAGSSGNDKSLYFISIYLAPGDYHRFHSPCDFSLSSVRHIFGESFPVVPLLLRWINSIYVLNERTPCLGTWKYGRFSMTPVGSTNVNQIMIHPATRLDTTWNLQFKEAMPSSPYAASPWTCSVETSKKYSGRDAVSVALKTGEEIGYFKMGSTIVLIFEAPNDFQFLVEQGEIIKMGSPLGHKQS